METNIMEAASAQSPKYTPTQQRLLECLSDGLRHTKEELIACLWDELSSKGAVAFHMSTLRKILRPRGQDIICEAVGYSKGYRHVRLLKSPYNE